MRRPSARDHNAGDTAMTEIALALAMAFFSILVLALVSMGAQGIDDASDHPTAAELIAAALAPQAEENDATATTVQPEDVLIVYHGGSFFDATLSPMSDAAVDQAVSNAPSTVRVILAVAPDLSIEEAMGIRGRFDRPDAIVTTLNDAWMARLSE